MPSISDAKSTAEKARILIVDDDSQIRRLLRITLAGQGFEVDEASSGREALDRIRTAKYDLVILDINMPGMDGVETCREIRAISNVSVIMVTVCIAERDKTEALEAGADDYVTKPFSTPELLARIRASLRRRTFPLKFVRRRLQLGDVEINFEARQVRARLTPKELDLLSYLAANANRVITHQELLREVWGSDSGGEREYLRVFVNRLRKKIERTPDDPKYLLTEHWLGYRLRLPY